MNTMLISGIQSELQRGLLDGLQQVELLESQRTVVCLLILITNIQNSGYVGPGHTDLES